MIRQTLLALALLLFASCAHHTPFATGEVALQEIAPGVWIHRSQGTYPGDVPVESNGLVVREGEALILIDTAWGEQLTSQLLERIRSEIGLPLRAAIITHAHHDRLAGVDLLEARGIPVHAHPLTLRRAMEWGGPVPDLTLDSLETAGTAQRFGHMELFYPGAGHTIDNITVWIPAARILFGGCAVRALDATGPGNVAHADLSSWQTSLIRLQERYAQATTVVPGHGAMGSITLLDHTLALVRKAAVQAASSHGSIR